VFAGVFIISFPSIPTFLFLNFIETFFNSKLKKNSNSSTSKFSFLNIMIAFSCGTLLGDVFLHIIPFLYYEEIKSSLSEENQHDHHHHHGSDSD